jgi:hypothetical protein
MRIAGRIFRRKTLRGHLLIGTTLAVIALVSCDRCAVRGAVVDMNGEPLPGVAVTAATGEAEALTNALGQYTLYGKPGAMDLYFMKDGYTSGRLAIEIAEPRTANAVPVSLWRLPQTAGVFLFETNRYRGAAPLQPKQFLSSGNTFIYGTQRIPNLEETTSTAPLLLCHRMPLYDVRFCRLHSIPASAPEIPGSALTVWASEAAFPVEIVPLDEPERYLAQIRLSEPLTPGVYAVHWGALDGYGTTDRRMFLFRVVDAARAPETQEPAAEPSPAKPDTAAKPEAAKPAKEPPAAEIPPDTRAVDAEADSSPQEPPDR